MSEESKFVVQECAYSLGLVITEYQRVFEKLFGNGAESNKLNGSSWTFFIEASCKIWFQILEFSIENKSKINQANNDGLALVSMPCFKGHL